MLGASWFIDTTDARPVRQPSRRVAKALKEITEAEIQSILRKGIIERGQNSWTSPVVLVKKKAYSLRFVRTTGNWMQSLNSTPISYLGGTRYWKSLTVSDILSHLTYFRGTKIEITKAAKQRSAYVVRTGHYLFKILPLGCSRLHWCLKGLWNLFYRAFSG